MGRSVSKIAGSDPATENYRYWAKDVTLGEDARFIHVSAVALSTNTAQPGRLARRAARYASANHDIEFCPNLSGTCRHQAWPQGGSQVHPPGERWRGASCAALSTLTASMHHALSSAVPSAVLVRGTAAVLEAPAKLHGLRRTRAPHLA